MVGNEALGGLLKRLPRPHKREAGIEKPHARLDVASVMGSERQNAGRDRVLEWRAGGRHISCRKRGGGATP